MKGYFDVGDYLAEAEGTPALRDCVLSFDPHQIDWTRGYTSGYELAAYLSVIQQLVRMLKISPLIYLLAVVQDFGDGVGGSVYQQQLDVIVRYLSESYPSYLKEVEESHPISDILAQTEIESAALWKDASARHEWQEIKSDHLGISISTTIQNIFRREIEAREKD